MNVFLPIASCLLFSSSYNPLLFHPYPDLEMAYPFCFSDSFTCPGDTTRSFTLTPSGSLRITLLQDSPLCLIIFPSMRQTCFHLSHLKEPVLFQLLPISFLAFLLDRLIQVLEGFGFFFSIWTSRLALIPSTEPDCPCPASCDYQIVLFC